MFHSFLKFLLKHLIAYTCNTTKWFHNERIRMTYDIQNVLFLLFTSVGFEMNIQNFRLLRPCWDNLILYRSSPSWFLYAFADALSDHVTFLTFIWLLQSVCCSKLFLCKIGVWIGWYLCGFSLGSLNARNVFLLLGIHIEPGSSLVTHDFIGLYTCKFDPIR